MKIEGDILGRGAKVRVCQRFKNEESKAIEAVYKFPLPEGASICGFKAHIDEKTIQGGVEERDKAFEMYDDALSRGDGGYLLDEERPNIFTLSVGNINPGSEVLVEIEYVTRLDMEGPRTKFFLPTTISPRYIPDGMDDGDGILPRDKIHPPYAIDVSYGLSLSLRIHQGRMLRSVESPTHQIKIDMKDDPVQITFSSESVMMDRDFILYTEFEDAFTNRAYRFVSGNEAFFQLDLMLNTETKKAEVSKGKGASDNKKEIIFVVDCSGSMSGDSIREAKNALEVCVRGLERQNAFNIYRFGSSYESLFRTSMDYTKKSSKKALQFLNRMDADLGGTEILKPLQHIYSTGPFYGNGKRDIILMTDGKVGNEDEILRLVRNNQVSSRVFSLGIGAGCNEFFIKGIARAGRGASEFVYPGERIEPKTLRIFNKIDQPGIDDVSIHWGDSSADQAPARPSVFLESPITIFSRCNINQTNSRVAVKGTFCGHVAEWEIDVTDTKQTDLPIPILWARERIRDLEESEEVFVGRGSRQVERKEEKVKDVILDLSKKYSLLSRFTSFVGIEEREAKDKTTGELIFRKVPAQVTVGWHGIGDLSGLSLRQAASSWNRERALIERAIATEGIAGDRALNFVKRSLVLPMIKMPSRLFKLSGGFPTMQDAAPSYTINTIDTIDIILSILSLQKAEGGMVITKEISELLNLDLPELMKVATDMMVEVSVDKFLLLSTAILLKVLEIRFNSGKAIWEGVTEKSKNWLDDALKECKPTIYGENIMSWVEKYVWENVRIRLY